MLREAIPVACVKTSMGVFEQERTSKNTSSTRWLLPRGFCVNASRKDAFHGVYFTTSHEGESRREQRARVFNATWHTRLRPRGWMSTRSEQTVARTVPPRWQRPWRGVAYE